VGILIIYIIIFRHSIGNLTAVLARLLKRHVLDHLQLIISNFRLFVVICKVMCAHSVMNGRPRAGVAGVGQVAATTRVVAARTHSADPITWPDESAVRQRFARPRCDRASTKLSADILNVRKISSKLKQFAREGWKCSALHRFKSRGSDRRFARCSRVD